MSETLYIKLDQAKNLEHSKVTIGDIAELSCTNKKVIQNISGVILLENKSRGQNRYVTSVMDIIRIVQKKYPEVDIECIGETECVVMFQNQKSRHRILEIAKVLMICIILFFGAGFSIMAFNNDAGIYEMFRQIVSKFSVNQHLGIRLIETGYSLGIGIGILVFYNHFFKVKLSKDPTPIEVEMRKYEKEINLTIIEEYGRFNKK